MDQDRQHTLAFKVSDDALACSRFAFNYGIDSFKVEGRTKSVYYLSIITRAYRRALDSIREGIPVSQAYVKSPGLEELFLELTGSAQGGAA